MTATTHQAGVHASAPPPAPALRTVVVVGNRSDDRVLDTVFEAGDFDVVFLEPASGAYSRIKRVSPNMVILCLTFDDAEAFQLLSMLKADRNTASIPLATCLLEPAPADTNV